MYYKIEAYGVAINYERPPGNFRKTPADFVAGLPLGTEVMVRIRNRNRMYTIVRWGKHHLKRLKWQRGLDSYPWDADEYLPIRDGAGFTLKTVRGDIKCFQRKKKRKKST